MGPFCFSGFEGKAEITGDLTDLVSKYNMAVSSKKLFEKVNDWINEGGKINVYTDLPIVFADPVLDPMTYSLHSYPYDMRDDFIKQYKSAKEGRIEPSVFISCTYLGDEAQDAQIRQVNRDELIQVLSNAFAVSDTSGTWNLKNMKLKNIKIK